MAAGAVLARAAPPRAGRVAPRSSPSAPSRQGPVPVPLLPVPGPAEPRGVHRARGALSELQRGTSAGSRARAAPRTGCPRCRAAAAPPPRYPALANGVGRPGLRGSGASINGTGTVCGRVQGKTGRATVLFGYGVDWMSSEVFSKLTECVQMELQEASEEGAHPDHCPGCGSEPARLWGRWERGSEPVRPWVRSERGWERQAPPHGLRPPAALPQPPSPEPRAAGTRELFPCDSLAPLQCWCQAGRGRVSTACSRCRMSSFLGAQK